MATDSSSSTTCRNRVHSNAGLPSPRLDDLPFEIVATICRQALASDVQDLSHDLDPKHDLVQLARVAPNCYMPALRAVVRHADRFCLIEPNAQVCGVWTLERAFSIQAVGCIAFDVRSPRVPGPDGLARPPMYLLLGAVDDTSVPPREIVPRGMAVLIPPTAIRTMAVMRLNSWVLDYPLPPKLAQLAIHTRFLTVRAQVGTLAGHALGSRRQRLGVHGRVHIPTIPIPMIARTLPSSMHNLLIISPKRIDDTDAELLASALSPWMRHVRLAGLATKLLSSRGVMAILAHLPADQLVSLDLSHNGQSAESLHLLAHWLQRTTRLELLAVDFTLSNANSPNQSGGPIAFDPVLAALPTTLRTLSLKHSIASAAEFAKSAVRLRHLHTLHLSYMSPAAASSLATLIPCLPPSVRELDLSYIDLNGGMLLTGLMTAHTLGVQFPELVKLNLWMTGITMEQLAAILDALKNSLRLCAKDGPRKGATCDADRVCKGNGRWMW
ncbi:hypothetical protein AMAG_12290 [Allomyces macrogynus ATCC 38327]|uniref:F-box domain-containing protein n=1 Tax=Allomyces macrogynus (strain ATCC 38327) TaxID=578462 RepID=A0A0L0SY09_ALLM3|nr:hypothetical protein AMAG_12290 [Allomyces macrogynus ATCC 38327]|eukprot:KNE67219.1 hypothetical protein AMAG_12290 [Allomyces macrogynus ATCC 38327]